MVKITQITGVGSILIALTDKGQLFSCSDLAFGDWRPIPLPDFEKIKTPKSKTPEET